MDAFDELLRAIAFVINRTSSLFSGRHGRAVRNARRVRAYGQKFFKSASVALWKAPEMALQTLSDVALGASRRQAFSAGSKHASHVVDEPVILPESGKASTVQAEAMAAPASA